MPAFALTSFIKQAGWNVHLRLTVSLAWPAKPVDDYLGNVT